MRIKKFSCRADISVISTNEVRLEFLESFEPRKGNATKFLLFLCEMCDEYRLDFSLLPVANSGMPLKKLRAWYAKFGFVDYEAGMIRKWKK